MTKQALQPTAQLVVHGVTASGHVHRVTSFLGVLGLPFRLVESPANVRATAAFLKLNPLGQIPVLEDGPVVVCDSNAILVYLARTYAIESHWLPDDPLAAAEVQRWFSIAAGEIAFGPATARVGTLFNREVDFIRARALSSRVLTFMEAHLREREWLACRHPTLADVACYPYIARAPEGRVDLAPFAAVRAWIQRVEAIDGFTPMPHVPIP